LIFNGACILGVLEAPMSITPDFFRNCLDQMIDLRHPLAVLANRIPWQEIEASVSTPPFKRKPSPTPPTASCWRPLASNWSKRQRPRASNLSKPTPKHHRGSIAPRDLTQDDDFESIRS
jgi:hypothetical protein